VNNRTPCYRQVRLQDINLGDKSYSLNPFPQNHKQDLLQSINELGILQPPLLLEQQDGKYSILSGRKRITAYLQQEGGDDHITALIITSDKNNQKPSPLYLFSSLLQHQLLGRPLTLIEQAIFFQKATQILDEQDILSFLPLLGLKPKPHIPGELIALLELDRSVQQGIHNGIIPQRSGKKLARFSPADQKKLADIIYEYQLGGSKQQKLLERCFQLTKRQQNSVKELIDSWKEKVREKNLNGPQKATSLLHWLDQQYQPRLTQAEEEFKKFSAQLQLPAYARVEHSPSFEEKQVTLSMNFSSKEELARIWPQIKILIKEE
jgi:ParB family chromosome partitioning protein